jgi:uncharacterized hydrophobic protein (TIGR00271 family)
VLQLRVYGRPPAITAAAERLGALPGARHVGLVETSGGGEMLLTADVRTTAADAALATLDSLGIAPDDVALVRLDTIGPAGAAAEPLALVWADVLGQARLQARAPARFLVLMAVAGVIAAFGVLNESPVLIVGAMATSPDLLPVTAACTGLVLHRRRLVIRGLGALVLGLGVTWLTAAAVTAFLRLFDLLPAGFSLGEVPASQSHVNATTILVALSAGAAGMLAVETRASAAVGVAISVTTIPAAAYLGVALGTGELGGSVSALAVLAANIAMMLVGGSTALAVQRWAAASRQPGDPVPQQGGREQHEDHRGDRPGVGDEPVAGSR